MVKKIKITLGKGKSRTFTFDPKEVEKERRRTEKKQKYLLEHEKTPESLITPIKGLVKKVLSSSDSTSFSISNGIIGPGGGSRHYSGGYTCKTDIEIESETPVKKLTFYGYTSAVKGDEITVYVVKGKFEDLPQTIYDKINNIDFGGSGKSQVLLEGELKEGMIALQIDIQSKGRSDTGTNYHNKKVSEPFI